MGALLQMSSGSRAARLSAPGAPAEPPPGPFRPTFWRSPLRGPWLTSFLGTLLVPLIVVIALTGLISHDAYHPELGSNATVDPAHDIGVLCPPSGRRRRLDLRAHPGRRTSRSA